MKECPNCHTVFDDAAFVVYKYVVKEECRRCRANTATRAWHKRTRANKKLLAKYEGITARKEAVKQGKELKVLLRMLLTRYRALLRPHEQGLRRLKARIAGFHGTEYARSKTLKAIAARENIIAKHEKAYEIQRLIAERGEVPKDLLDYVK